MRLPISDERLNWLGLMLSRFQLAFVIVYQLVWWLAGLRVWVDRRFDMGAAFFLSTAWLPVTLLWAIFGALAMGRHLKQITATREHLDAVSADMDERLAEVIAFQMQARRAAGQPGPSAH